jgi:cell division septum initiation protein DivIVA
MPTIAVSVKRDVYEALKKLAESRNMSLYELVKRALEELASTVSAAPSSQLSEASSKIDQLIKAVSMLQEADRELERRLTEISARVEQLERRLAAQSGAEHSGHATSSDAKASAHSSTTSRAAGGKTSPIEVLRKQKVECLSDLARAGKKMPEKIIEKAREMGAVVVRTEEDVCAVDPEFWELFKRELNNARTVDDKEVLSKLRDEKMKRLFQLLRKAGALYLDSRTREWVYDYSFIEEPGDRSREEEEVPVDWEL